MFQEKLYKNYFFPKFVLEPRLEVSVKWIILSNMYFAIGAATGIVTYLTDIIKMIGKPIIKLLDAIPRPKFIDSIIDMFKAEGMVGKLFTNIKGFFVGEGTFFKRIGISTLYFSFKTVAIASASLTGETRLSQCLYSLLPITKA